MDEQLAIMEFENGQEAIKFAEETWPDQSILVEIMDSSEELRAGQDCLLVIGVCDICNNEEAFFMPAGDYLENPYGCECDECGNMSLYPKEFNDEN